MNQKGFDAKAFGDLANLINSFAKELEENLVTLDKENVHLFKDINIEAENKFKELKRELNDLETKLSNKW